MSEGRLRGWHITCPLHGASFDIRDGSHGGPPAWEGVPCYQVERVDGDVVVNLAGPSDEDGDDSGGGGLGALRTR